MERRRKKRAAARREARAVRSRGNLARLGVVDRHFADGAEGPHTLQAAALCLKVAELKIGILNLRGLRVAGQIRALTLLMERKGLDVRCLQETKLPSCARFKSGIFTFLLSSSSDGPKEHLGVGFVLSKREPDWL